MGAAVAEWLSSWLAEQEDGGSIPGLGTWIFRDWLSPASKSRYGWKIAKSTLILKTTNQSIHIIYQSTITFTPWSGFRSVHNCIAFLYARLQTTYYGMVMSVRVSIRVSVRPSVRLSVRPTLRPSGLRPPIFRTFLLHAFTYWAEILHMTLFWFTTDQVRLSSLCVNFWRSYASLWT